MHKGDWRKKKVIVVGGGGIGSETAEFLARKGADVTIVEVLPELATDMEFQSRFLLHTRLLELGVAIKTRYLFEEIKRNSVVIMDLEKLERKTIDADIIVVALGVFPNDDLSQSLKEKPMETYFIGDCVKPRKVVNAIHEASFIARQI